MPTTPANSWLNELHTTWFFRGKLHFTYNPPQLCRRFPLKSRYIQKCWVSIRMHNKIRTYSWTSSSANWDSLGHAKSIPPQGLMLLFLRHIRKCKIAELPIAGKKSLSWNVQNARFMRGILRMARVSEFVIKGNERQHPYDNQWRQMGRKWAVKNDDYDLSGSSILVGLFFTWSGSW